MPVPAGSVDSRDLPPEPADGSGGILSAFLPRMRAMRRTYGQRKGGNDYDSAAQEKRPFRKQQLAEGPQETPRTSLSIGKDTRGMAGLKSPIRL